MAVDRYRNSIRMAADFLSDSFLHCSENQFRRIYIGESTVFHAVPNSRNWCNVHDVDFRQFFVSVGR